MRRSCSVWVLPVWIVLSTGLLGCATGTVWSSYDRLRRQPVEPVALVGAARAAGVPAVRPQAARPEACITLHLRGDNDRLLEAELLVYGERPGQTAQTWVSQPLCTDRKVADPQQPVIQCDGYQLRLLDPSTLEIRSAAGVQRVAIEPTVGPRTTLWDALWRAVSLPVTLAIDAATLPIQLPYAIYRYPSLFDGMHWAY